ncbi:methyltransferase domain-containing protein [Leptolyngbya sp. PCC 6406]|uniref:methyltransferase domain-containing protein n=1 Tax=Leptolyngbya sp. PCC 6406 TaxID=1173264 RepID=UPI0002AC870E|nr:methyltransferase domain-containing protein [Leptolyngbya sp. PCC 6406]
MAFTSPPLLSSEFWESRYQEGATRWDLGQPSPAFVEWLDQQNHRMGRVLVLGCGRGHDALLFAQAGFDVLGVDYAPSAIAAATAVAQARNLNAEFRQRDIFTLLPEYTAQFDYVVEHTCFCAIDPTLRDRYVTLVQGLLKPGGYLLGVFFTHDRPGGPPYGTTPVELRQRFTGPFAIVTLNPVTSSVPTRQGEEYLGLFQNQGISSRS